MRLGPLRLRKRMVIGNQINQRPKLRKLRRFQCPLFVLARAWGIRQRRQ
jgi:hypothetical protein